MPPSRALNTWALLAGLALFVPALGVPLGSMPLQPLDLLVVLGAPLLVMKLRHLDRRTGLVGVGLVLSLGLSWALADGQILVLAHGVFLVLPFLGLCSLVARSAPSRAAFLKGLLIGGGGTILLFFAQILVGAEHLDWRSNTGFSLPPQYGRGFGLFPEVSTLAVHLNIVLAVSLVLLWHPVSRNRGLAACLAVLCLAALMLTRSTSFLLIAPLLCTVAAARAQRLRPATLLRFLGVASLGALLLYVFFVGFYADRLETAAASRSFQMRLASILGGLSPLWTGELFGVGLGENHQIARRAHDIAHQVDLRFGTLPSGVNSQLVARIFEEGWPALLHILLGGAVLMRGLRRWSPDPVITALMVIACGSFLSAAAVTGYRAIYTNWLWLGLPAGLIAAQTPVRRRTAPQVRQRILRSSVIEARRA